MYTPHCVPHRVYRFAPCVAVRIVYIGSHRAYRFAPCVPIHTVCTRGKVCTGSHRMYRFTPGVLYRVYPTACTALCSPYSVYSIVCAGSHLVYHTVCTRSYTMHRSVRKDVSSRGLGRSPTITYGCRYWNNKRRTAVRWSTKGKKKATKKGRP